MTAKDDFTSILGHDVNLYSNSGSRSKALPILSARYHCAIDLQHFKNLLLTCTK